MPVVRSHRAPEVGPIELRSIAQAFNGRASELRTQRENQARFLGGVAHDLRNPLGAPKSACALLCADRPLPSEPHLRRLFLTASRSVDRLNAMVEDLLDISRVELGRQLVEAHGGRLTVDSVPGKGMTFQIRLPRSAQAAATSGPRRRRRSVTAPASERAHNLAPRHVYRVLKSSDRTPWRLSRRWRLSRAMPARSAARVTLPSSSRRSATR